MLFLAVAVVTEEIKRNVDMSCLPSLPLKARHQRSRQLCGCRAAGGAKRPCAAFQNRLDAKSFCHHYAHRFSVQRLTPMISRNLCGNPLQTKWPQAH